MSYQYVQIFATVRMKIGQFHWQLFGIKTLLKSRAVNTVTSSPGNLVFKYLHMASINLLDITFRLARVTMHLQHVLRERAVHETENRPPDVEADYAAAAA
jgi:hypothetical protein